MKRQKRDSKEECELRSMNKKLYSDFSIEELEQRLETDPLLFGSLFDTMELTKKCTVTSPSSLSPHFY
jgi:hypothetical protein